ncbi:MAG TPA: hypothetical protein VFX48_00175, partial [Saprospiraceae bacterium]|nr:hypothetical protein [Saprospiraceae bacterium]
PQFIDLYLTLSPRQKQSFQHFLDCPLFNKNDKLSRILPVLKGFLSDFPDTYRQQLFHFLYPGKPYEDIKLRLLFSEYLKLFKHFVFIEEKQDSGIERELSFIRFLRKKKFIRLFENQASSFRKELVQKQHWDPEVYEWRHQLDLELLSYESFKNRFSYFDFAESTEFLEVSSMIKRLRIYLEQLSHESISATSLEYPLIQSWIQYAETRDWSRYPEIRIYLLALKMYQHPEEEHYFDTYLSTIRRYEQDFDFERGREIFLTALNYCIRKINQNTPAFFQKGLDLFQDCVRSGWLLDYGVMSSLTYKNIIALCIRMNDLKLAIQLLEDYKNLVSAKERNTIYHFNLAKIYKEQKEYSKALYLLQTSVFKDPLIELNARVEMIKIYYEIREGDLMHLQIQATRNLIKRSSKLGYHREYYSNFLQQANRLFNVKRMEPEEKTQWLAEIRSDPRLIDKNWLFTMVDKFAGVAARSQ